MSVLNEYGDLATKLDREGYPIDFRILSSVAGDTLPSMAKSIGLLQITAVDYLEWLKPNWLILSGDRAEQLAAAIAGSYCYVPTAHIQAGERSGNIDGVARHAITKLVHLHFASNKDASDRLIKMGEEAFRVHLTGAPQLDDIHNLEKFSPDELLNQRIVKDPDPYFVVCFHPDTNQLPQSREHLQNLVEAVNNFDLNPVWILPNNDAWGESFRMLILDNLGKKGIAHSNLERRTYLSLISGAQFLLGNSSSGILEAPTLKLPAINIGNRQLGRVQGQNVINVPGNDVKVIIDAMKNAVVMRNSDSLSATNSPYGDGSSSEKILDILETTEITSNFLNKKLTY